MGNGNGAREGCGRFVRFCLIFTNFVILIGGLVVLGVGLWTLIDKSYIEVLLRNELYMSSTYIMIIVGSATTFVSFIGCFGAHKELKCLLLTYFILILFFFVILTIGGVLGYVFRDQVANNLRPEMLHTVEIYDPKNSHDKITAAWDATQTNLKCCGIGREKTENEPWMSWKMNDKLNPGSSPDLIVPFSCCVKYDNGTRSECVVDGKTDMDLVYQTDCFTVGLAFVKGHAVVIGGVAIGIASTMVFGMAFSLILFKVIV